MRLPSRIAAAFVAVAALSPLPSAGAGLTSGNVEWLGNIGIVTDGVGGRLVDGYFYVTDQNKLMIFDVSIPEIPVLTGVLPFPQEFLLGREDVDTNGEILLLPNTAVGPPTGASLTGYLYVVDVSDKRLPRILSVVPGGGGHTVACALGCTWAYSSDGPITDLRDPRNPVLHPSGSPRGHDIEEVAPGFLLSPGPRLWDVRSTPLSPVLVARPDRPDGNSAWHSLRWPREGTDRFALGAGETFPGGPCRVGSGAFSTWDTTGWQVDGRLKFAGLYQLENGTPLDGHPARNVIGCSAHWFDAHRDFHDGGLVALAAYEHGVRFLDVAGDGSIAEVGWWLPVGGETGAAYWITDEIVYAVDYARGLDILRFTG